ncbi:hypothetical protein BCR34DRAFT_669622 [Clohesyomyces aquaticus]|uniref:RRM domain-containing protein n=1 Tax=Clohesyomyces aquaticus TaxID=1231657 RepID=A0A1Y1Y9J1_9PLEO|nr:hypothetical protein BCR34DRAFT_669622 [Clohesyomyces aquaticus]
MLNPVFARGRSLLVTGRALQGGIGLFAAFRPQCLSAVCVPCRNLVNFADRSSNPMKLSEEERNRFVYIARISRKAMGKEIRKVLERVGISDGKVVLRFDRFTGLNPGSVWLEMPSASMVPAVIEKLNGQELAGAELTAEKFKAPDKPLPTLPEGPEPAEILIENRNMRDQDGNLLTDPDPSEMLRPIKEGRRILIRGIQKTKENYLSMQLRVVLQKALADLKVEAINRPTLFPPGKNNYGTNVDFATKEDAETAIERINEKHIPGLGHKKLGACQQIDGLAHKFDKAPEQITDEEMRQAIQGKYYAE